MEYTTRKDPCETEELEEKLTKWILGTKVPDSVCFVMTVILLDCGNTCNNGIVPVFDLNIMEKVPYKFSGDDSLGDKKVTLISPIFTNFRNNNSKFDDNIVSSSFVIANIDSSVLL